jgi:glucosamine-6-phosphate deaminase
MPLTARRAVAVQLADMLAIPTEELQRHTPIPIKVLPDLTSLYRHMARHMADAIETNNAAGRPTSFILPVGPTQQYPELARIINAESIDCGNLTTFNMDDYLDWQGRAIPEDHPMSFRRAMRDLLWTEVDARLRMPEERMYFPDVRCPETMDEAFDRYGPVDVCYASVGYHGHVAFNEGITSRWHKVSEEEFLNARTHLVALAADTFVINSAREAGGNCEMIPPFAVTVGMRDIMAARHMEVVFYCGHWQQTVLRRTLFQDPTVEYPGTFLKRHESIAVSADAVTAAPPEVTPY